MDDLLDLNWSSSSNPKQSAPTPSSSQFSFDSLARAGSGSNNSTNYYGSNGSSNGTLRSVSPSNAIMAPSRASSTNSNDAFSSLFDAAGSSSTSSSSSSRNQAQSMQNMTMQQRMQLQRGGSGSNTPINAGVAQKTSADPWDFDMLTSTSPKPLSVPSTTKSSSQPRASSPFDDLADFAASTSQVRLNDSSNNKKTPAASFNSNEDDFLGLLGQPVPVVRKASPPRQQQPLHAPRAQRPSSSSDMLSSPSSATSSRPPSRAVAARTPSPPPHILGQLVMLGFSVQQAKLALAATLGGKKNGEWDLEGAMEVLASDGAGEAQLRSKGEVKSQRSSGRRAAYEDNDDEEQEGILGQRKQRERNVGGGQQRTTDSRQQEPRRQTSSPAALANQSDAQNANDLLAQASVFGNSMLKSATGYWKTSRAQIQKAVEENKFLQAQLAAKAAGSGSGSNGGSRSTTPNNNGGRPKWMTEDVPDEEDTQKGAAGKSRSRNNRSQQAPSFKDDDDGMHDDVLPRNPADRPQTRTSQPRRREPEINLFQDDDTALPPHPSERRGASPASAASVPQAAYAQPSSRTSLKAPEVEKKIYASPNRRKAATPAAPAIAVSQRPTTPARPARLARTPVTASSSALSSSKAYRALGNEHFKLGRYGEASEAYSKALDILPEGHLARIAVLNNRANARLKNGEEKRAVEDASAVLVIMLGDAKTLETVKKEEYQSVLVELEGVPEGGGERLDPHDALGKALTRRARGNEGCEKWRMAMMDWQILQELGDQRVLKSAGGIKVVSDGLARCRKVVDSGGGSGSMRSVPSAIQTAKPPPQPTKPKPRPKPSVPVSTKPSAAVNALRQEAIQQEAEDDERSRLKDTVDARITNWKGGKEANLRALIASLDGVLWGEAGWKKVGMHELITENQLKIRYMKAIAKVHPDKISKDATVEQRMLADAIFSSLNEAWNVQK